MVERAENRDDVLELFQILRLNLHDRLVSVHVANKKGEWNIRITHGLHYSFTMMSCATDLLGGSL